MVLRATARARWHRRWRAQGILGEKLRGTDPRDGDALIKNALDVHPPEEMVIYAHAQGDQGQEWNRQKR